MEIPTLHTLITIAFLVGLASLVLRNFGKAALIIAGVAIGVFLVAAIGGCASGKHSIPADTPAVPAATAAGLADLPAASALAGEIPGITQLALPTPEPEPEPEPESEPAAATGQPAGPPASPDPPLTPPPPEPAPAAVLCASWRIDGVLFESGSASPSAEAQHSFDALAAQIPEDAEIAVVGHTDDIPISIGNQKLSELRAQAAADALVRSGLRPQQITAISGQGDTQPAASNATAEGRAQNRRVEILVSCPQSSQ